MSQYATTDLWYCWYKYMLYHLFEYQLNIKNNFYKVAKYFKFQFVPMVNPTNCRYSIRICEECKKEKWKFRTHKYLANVSNDFDKINIRVSPYLGPRIRIKISAETQSTMLSKTSICFCRRRSEITSILTLDTFKINKCERLQDISQF